MAILVSDVNTRIRSLVGDSATDWTTSAILLPYINAAYEKVATLLRARGITILRKTSAAITVLTGTTAITRSGGTTYPGDLVRPIELVERVSGSGSYVRMVQSQGVMQDRATSTLFGEWDWNNDEIHFVGASGDVQVKIHYDATLAALTADSDTLLIQDCLNAVAFFAASDAVRGRGQSALAADLATQGQTATDAITAAELTSKESLGGRWGPQDQSTANSVQSVIRLASVLLNKDPKLPGVSDADLMPFIRAAYREVARRLRAEGATLFRRTSAAITVTAGTTALLRSSGTQYPSDLVRPLEVMERENVVPFFDVGRYHRMSKSTGLFEDRAQTSLLQEWEWKDDGIRFGPGASADVQVKIEYDAALPELDKSTDILLIPDSADTVAYLAASYAMGARVGQDPAVHDRVEKRAQASVAALIAGEAAVRQPITGRWGLQDETTPTVGRVTAQHVVRLMAPLCMGMGVEEAGLFQFVRLAYQDVAKMLRGMDMKVFVRYATVNINSGVSSITRISSPALPSDLIRPLYISSLVDQDPANRWALVSSSKNSILRPSDDSLGTWEWRDDGIYFPQTTSSYSIRIVYDAVLADLASPQDEIGISEGATAVAFLAASYATTAAGKVDVGAALKARAIEIARDIAEAEKHTATAMTGNSYYENA